MVGVLLGSGAHLLVSPRSDAAVSGRLTGTSTRDQVEVAGNVVSRHGDVPDAAADAAISSVVRVETSSCGTQRRASAVQVLTDQGRSLLVTAAHVVAGATDAVVWMPDGTRHSVAVLGAIHGVDAALLASPDAPVAPLPLGPEVGPGDHVVIAGHPAGDARLDGTTVISREVRVAPGALTDVLLTAASVRGGHSGGALLDPDGRVVALIVARDPLGSNAVAHPMRTVLTGSLVAVPGC